MNSTDLAFVTCLDRRTLLRSLLFATGGIITNSLYAEALTLPPGQKNNRLAIDAKPGTMTIPSRYPDIEKEMGEKLVGVKMLCIDDSFTDEQIAKCDVLAVHGNIYTIRAFRIAFRVKEDQYHPLLLFDEIVNTRLIFGKEPGFWATRFEFYDPDDG